MEPNHCLFFPQSSLLPARFFVHLLRLAVQWTSEPEHIEKEIQPDPPITGQPLKALYNEAHYF